MSIVLKLMPDYECHPLWEMREDDASRNLSPYDLELSSELTIALRAWANRFDQTLNQEYPPDSGFATPTDEDAFEREGLRLRDELKRELGSKYKVVYYSVKDERLVE